MKLKFEIMKKDIKGDLAVAISEGRKKLRFKAGTELPDKVNLVVIDVEEVEERDGARFVVHVEFTSTASTGSAAGSVNGA